MLTKCQTLCEYHTKQKKAHVNFNVGIGGIDIRGGLNLTVEPYKESAIDAPRFFILLIRCMFN